MGDSTTSGQAFDLNIGKVLEHWTVPFAVREVIANALDEATLSGTPDPVISKDEQGRWHVRDFGRGLEYAHLTQNESAEKRRHDGVVGQFGMGLKDALAVFDRRGVSVSIRSRHGDISTARQGKAGFGDVVTLHAVVQPPSDSSFVGTDVVLAGVSDAHVEEAKGLFLRFSDEEVLEDTDFGQVLRRARGAKVGRVYVRGLLVATEDNFLFSYNITKLSTPLRRALNRERSNVGRSAYTDRVKRMLTACTSTEVVQALTADLANWQAGTMRDELEWNDVALHACRVLQTRTKTVFVTAWQLAEGSPQLEYAQQDGYQLLTVPDSIARALRSMVDETGRPMVDLDQYRREFNDSFSYELVDPERLTAKEASVFAHTDALLKLGAGAAGSRSTVRQVVVSETMRLSEAGAQVVGVWDEQQHRIIVRRDQLGSLPAYAGTVLHELAHAQSGTVDNSLAFEDALTEVLGQVAATAVLSPAQAPPR